MRAILWANATVATCLRLRAARLASHVLRPEDCFVLCSSTVCAPSTKSFRKIFVSTSAGTGHLLLASAGVFAGHHSQPGANPRPFLKAAPLPMAAIVAVAITG